ncbi:hypothetical protein VTL71DRAFT_7867 [Oculimacula yallundae]|uniref:Uncharacterized protein n=1 Tax=Oculimacula yallundae TaxID=86028 RepID=A0ABR4CYE7_9HELO
MPNANDTGVDQGPISSFEELETARIWAVISPPVYRLFWPLEGAFPEAISVMQDEPSPSLTPYYVNGVYHSISSEPVSEPKISSVTVRIQSFSNWEDAWDDYHERHEGMEGRLRGPLEPHEYDPEDIDPEDAWDRAHRLLACCGGDPRPRDRESVSITVVPAAGAFVTVHDYVSTLHPWLMGMKEDIWRSTDVWQGGLKDMMVVFYLDRVNCVDVAEKALRIRKPPVVYKRAAPLEKGTVLYLGPAGPDNESESVVYGPSLPPSDLVS